MLTDTIFALGYIEMQIQLDKLVNSVELFTVQQRLTWKICISLHFCLSIACSVYCKGDFGKFYITLSMQKQQ